MDRASAATLLAAMAGRRVLVLGDVALDEYLVGRPERLSREAALPVLAFRRRFCVPGGAANPAKNAARLGRGAMLVALVGQDDAARELGALLDDEGIDLAGLVTDLSRPTTRKTRVLAEGLSVPQQVARMDHQSREPAGPEATAGLRRALESGADSADAILVSHYRSGVVTDELAAAALATARAHGLLCTADAQGDLERFRGYDLVRVGSQDAARTIGRALVEEADIEATLRQLADRLEAGAIVLGRGGKGTSLLGSDGAYRVVPPANVSEVFDVTGAGDTVIAVLTLALSAGAGLLEAVELANLAAGIVVRRLGVVAPTAEEILAEVGGR